MTRRPAEAAPFPSRSSLPAPFVAAMAFWAACALAYSTGDVRDATLSVEFSCAAIAGMAVAVALAIPKRTRLAGVLLTACLTGLALGNAQAAEIHTASSELEGMGDAPAELTLLEDSRDNGFGESALVEARIGDNHAVTCTARFANSDPLLTGERLSAHVSFSPPDYEKDVTAWSKGMCGYLKVADAEPLAAPFPLGLLLDVRSRAIEGIGGEDDSHTLLQALVCGYRRNVSGTEMYSSFQTCGLAHLVAVSGAHLVIVTGLAATLLERMRVPRRLSVAALVTVMTCYFVIAGMPVSALRALAMSSLGLFAFFGRRRSSSLNAVGIATFAIVALSPSASVSASFALSALSTIGIVLFAPLLQAWLDTTPLRPFPLVSSSLSLTFAASVLSQLYACSLFNQLPLVAPLANVITAPLFPLACATGLVAGMACAVFPSVPEVLIAIASVPSALMGACVSFLSSIPHASVPFAIESPVALALSAIAALALWAAWPHPNWKGAIAFAAPCCILALVVTSAGFGTQDDALIALDVGQGDAILVQSRGQRYLVDTGNQDSKLLEQLALNRVTHLDGVVISHADDDHCGSIDALQTTVDVKRFVLAADMINCQGAHARSLVESARSCATEIVGMNAGDSFQIGAFKATVVWPRAFVEDGGNADSLCLMLDYDGDDDGQVDFKALLTGDAEKDELEAMLSDGAIGDVDILKVGHHGSRNGMTRDQAEALDPEIALVSCGKNNRYGHPAPEIVEMLDEVGASTLRTDQDGEIRCTLTPDSIHVTTLE